MKKRYFLIYGLRPAYGDAANKFLSAMDLGVSGAFYHFKEIATVTIQDDCSPEQLELQPLKIKEAYEKTGHTDVVIVEVEKE